MRVHAALIVLGVAGCRAPKTPVESEAARPVRARLERQLASTMPASRGAVVVAALDRRRGIRVVLGDENRVFELGSVTKALTGTLLGDEVLRGRMRLDDPAQQHLSGITLPTHAGGPIKLVHLATYTSGLPFMPTNWITVDEGTYTDHMWREFLASYTLPSVPGGTFIYGNVGFGVLGDALAAREKTSLEKLFRERIFEPLDMKRTWFLGSRPKGADVAQGHDEHGTPVALDRDKPLQAGCCAIESTAGDLLRFLEAGLAQSPLTGAFDLALAKHVGAERIGQSHDVGLGWFLPEGESFAEKGGIMQGYRSAIVLDRRNDLAIVVLAADAAFPAEALARRARLGVLLERAVPPLPVVSALPKNASNASARWDTGVELIGWTAPKRAEPASSFEVCWFFRAKTELTDDYRVFVHGEAASAPRVRADHDPARPTSDWPAGQIVRDCFEVRVPEAQPIGQLTLWTGFFTTARMKLVAGGDNKDRARGPVIEIGR